MRRYRLRFLLQEFDLHGPELLLGRSGDCHITLEDPLVSRTHARIVVEPEPGIEDLGSRNGVKVNGQRIQGRARLADGDRIRLGTQELVFTVVRRRQREPRPTGFMRNCQACGTPFPEGAPQCPHCGAVQTEREEEDTTISGLLMEPSRSWTFQLLGEVIDRAIRSGRTGEADRLLRRASGELEVQIQQRAPLDLNQVEHISTHALRLAKAQGTPEWVAWVMRIHQELALMPADVVIDGLEQLNVGQSEVRDVLGGFVSHWRRKRTGGSDQGGLLRIERLLT